MEEKWVKLWEKLDAMNSGVGENTEYVMKYLKAFFHEDDIDYFLALGNVFETSDIVAERMQLPQKHVEEKLYDMSRRMLIFRDRVDGVTRYRVNPIAHGIYEFNVNHHTKEDFQNFVLAGKAQEPGQLGSRAKRARAYLPIQRTLPVNPNTVKPGELRDEDNPYAILDRHSRYAVTNCICAVQKRIEERGECEYPLERCISYDEWADYYVENEEGHYVDKQYILDMFKLADEYKRGLVVQVSNSVDGEFQCLCCPCCCGLVAMGKFLSGPCDEIQGNYVLEHDTSKCEGNCHSLCVSRCHFGALTVENDKLVYNKAKCTGCGLCVNVCPNQANILTRKPDNELYTPEGQTWHDTYNIVAKMREEKGDIGHLY